ncbi:SAM-dependent methyltransferase, partial [Faecalibaculum rodentium]
MRLDRLLAETMGSRAKAQDAIRAGRIQVDGKPVSKPSLDVSDPEQVTILPAEADFVSRAGAKLKKAVDVCSIDLQGQTVLDIGASTGGFTDVCLQHGAAKVYAVDVGHLQLADKLDRDPRVVKMEGVNARDLQPQDL